jgi:hypothetical protein
MKQWTLSNLLVVVIVVSALMAVAVPAVHRSHQGSLVRECGANQAVLITAAYNYCCNGKRTLPFPPMGGTGSQALLKIHDFEEMGRPALLWCPFRDDGVVGKTHFRGPRGDLGPAPATHYFACDQTGNHPPGVSLTGALKSGDVRTFEPATAEFDRAMAETAP